MKYADKNGVSVHSYHTFSSRKDWLEVTGKEDNADHLTVKGKTKYTILSPNHMGSEWPALIASISSDCRDTRVSKRQKIRTEQRPTVHWQADVAARDDRIKSLSSAKRMVQKESKQTINRLTMTIGQQQSTIKSFQTERNNWRRTAESYQQKLDTAERLKASIAGQLKRARTEDNLHLLAELRNLEITSGAFTRITMFDPEFHSRYPNVCKDMLGFDSFEECLEIVKATMPEIKVELSCAKSYDNKKQVIQFEPFTLFEQLMITKMFFSHWLETE